MDELLKMDEFERRSRLVSVAYDVLRDMEPPADGATTAVVLSALSQAFLDKAAAVAKLEGRPRGATRKSPMVWRYATPE